MHKIERFRTSNLRWSFCLCNAAAVIAVGIISSVSPAVVSAQGTTATIFGQAPFGEVVTVSSATGLHRHQTVNKTGKYKIGPLPQGDYTVTLESGGQAVKTQSGITLLVGQNAKIDFACPNDHCAAPENQ
ncbi:hypothetical protein GCM10007862_15670 [Dyella lipolytica]|uniref:Carboxypeptidase regulatory-like domain-containing protein n=1 Tax=Dyella lipolytica TaxID=1867835 RepID=A0ABW8ITC3_9GAMM|nr:carboxypeptidase-like regulatory domain-containing protein [Dyella lipolytica]GLQ46516.1 hypothetical protein GCM10007862_15670 [Dyella lipolytica]